MLRRWLSPPPRRRGVLGITAATGGNRTQAYVLVEEIERLREFSRVRYLSIHGKAVEGVLGTLLLTSDIAWVSEPGGNE